MRVENLNLRYKSDTNLAVAIAATLFLTPFAVNNFLQGRWEPGLSAVAVILLLTYSAWSIRSKQRVPWTTSFVLCPSIIAALVVILHKQGTVGAFWCYPAAVAFYFMLSEFQARLFNVILLLVIIPTAWTTIPEHLALRLGATLLAVIVFSGLSIRLINTQQERLEKIAITDALTGLHNRTLLEPTLQRAILLARRGTPSTILALDLDRFKLVNDTFGHQTGDKVLTEFSRILTTRLRKSDQIFRVGGEEFLVLLWDTDVSSALGLAEEVRKTTGSTVMIPGHPVTVSIGVASWEAEEDWSEWLKRADNYLYQAKELGRNRVCSDSAPSTEGGSSPMEMARSLKAEASF